jgi:hypothetical protein
MGKYNIDKRAHKLQTENQGKRKIIFTITSSVKVGSRMPFAATMKETFSRMQVHYLQYLLKKAKSTRQPSPWNPKRSSGWNLFFYIASIFWFKKKLIPHIHQEILRLIFKINHKYCRHNNL